MGLYIEGIEMPTGCGAITITVWPDGQTEVIEQDGEWKTSKAVTVPPHGRLIDGDALMLKIQDYITEYGETDERGWHNLKWCAMKEVEMAINDAETVLNSTR